MAIIALFQNRIAVEVVDAYQAGGVTLASVRALTGRPFMGGNVYPVPTEWATIKACELSGAVACELQPAQVGAILAAYDKAQAAAQAGKLEAGRVVKALTLALGSERRPYKTTPSGCNCPDSARGNYCKHRIAALIWQRAGVGGAA